MITHSVQKRKKKKKLKTHITYQKYHGISSHQSQCSEAFKQLGFWPRKSIHCIDYYRMWKPVMSYVLLQRDLKGVYSITYYCYGYIPSTHRVVMCLFNCYCYGSTAEYFAWMEYVWMHSEYGIRSRNVWRARGTK